MLMNECDWKGGQDQLDASTEQGNNLVARTGTGRNG